MIGNVPPVIPPQQPWRKKFPSIISGILSFVEFLVTIVIIGCEVGSMLIDIVTATIYVGLWASLFFIVAWISQSASSCCCHDRGCATYTLVIQCISMFFAACVIGFDSYYIVYPTTCFFSSSICSSSNRGVFYTSSNFNNIKIPLIKGQLAAGAVMFVLCLIYIILYLITNIRVHQDKKSSSIHPQPENQLSSVPTVSDGMITAPPINNYYPSTMVNNGDNRVTQLVCPTCNVVMHMTASKRPPM